MGPFQTDMNNIYRKGPFCHTASRTLNVYYSPVQIGLVYQQDIIFFYFLSDKTRIWTAVKMYIFINPNVCVTGASL